MNKKLLMKAVNFFFLFFLCFASAGWAQVPAFPGAEGYGSTTKGGRGGKIYKVTNLNNSGPGSLRECMEGSGARTCVFDVGGWINLLSTIRVTSPYLTVAGQTAPGGGVGIRNTQSRSGTHVIDIATHDVVVQYLTIRPGPGNTVGGNVDAIGAMCKTENLCYDVVIDHCSLSWTTDQIGGSWYDVKNTTFSYNLAADPLHWSTHSEAIDHGMGPMFGGYKDQSGDYGNPGRNYSIHHNLIAHAYERSPDLDNGGLNDVVNNIIYNQSGAVTMAIGRSELVNRANVIGNYYKEGPNSPAKPAVKMYPLEVGSTGGKGSCEVFVQGNYHNRYRTSTTQAENLVVESTQRNTAGQNTFDGTGHLVTSKFTGSPAITTQSAFDGSLLAEMTEKVGNSRFVDCSGTWQKRRDAVDKRVIEEFRRGEGKHIDAPGSTSCVGRCRGSSYTLSPSDYTKYGITDALETGTYAGWPVLAGGSPCIDTDKDAMPDGWETARGLNPNSAADTWLDRDGDGYSNLEEFIHGISTKQVPAPPTELRYVP